MQFFLNGYKAGDPLDSRKKPQHTITPPIVDLPEEVDVLIIGCGPAGLMLATQLSAFSNINTRIIDQKSGPLQVGQADGVSGRSIEIFQAFDFAERIIKESYYLKAISFWRADPKNADNIIRASKAPDGRDIYSEFPHVILNQARIHDFLLDRMKTSPAQLKPNYCRRLTDLEVSTTNANYPVKVTLERLDKEHEGQKEIVKARYVVGCDGARSHVRQALSLSMCGDSANKAWGVMDLLLVTDFPDIRIKSVIQSATEGNLMIIPREGGHLVRFYIEMDKLKESERVSSLQITSEQLIAAAQRIFHPYTLDIKEVVWWSVYEIGQRVTDCFDNVSLKNTGNQYPNVFIAGDACHTHSPKAGQGMNVSMHDSFNLGWKLASVIQGQCDPKILLTYNSERRAIAEELIAFDRKLSGIFSQPLKSADTDKRQSATTPTELQKYVVKLEGFMSGTMTRYQPSIIVAEPAHQHLAQGFPVGKRFHSSPVLRLIDACPVHLGHINKADGRWRIFAFADAMDPCDPAAKIQQLSTFLHNSSESPIQKFTPKGKDSDAVIDFVAVFQQKYFELEIEKMPAFLLPQKGIYGLHDYGKMFCSDWKVEKDIFDERQINKEQGCMVIVRPDQHIANILPLDEFTKLSEFFNGFMVDESKL